MLSMLLENLHHRFIMYYHHYSPSILLQLLRSTPPKTTMRLDPSFPHLLSKLFRSSSSVVLLLLQKI